MIDSMAQNPMEANYSASRVFLSETRELWPASSSDDNFDGSAPHRQIGWTIRRIADDSYEVTKPNGGRHTLKV